MSKWEMVKLEDVADINMGQSPSSETYNDIGNGLPFYQGKIDFGAKYPTARKYCSAPQKIAKKNDILLSVRAPVGSVNIAKDTCCIGRGLAAISQKEDYTNYEYLFSFLQFKEKDIANMGVGSTFKAIKKDDIRKITLPLPPLSVQRQIVDLLGSASSLIEKRKTQIEKLDLLVKSQFVQMFGDLTMAGNGDSMSILGAIAEIVSGITKGRKPKGLLDEVAYLRVANVKEGYIDLTEVKTIPINGAELEKYTLEKDDILMTEGGDPDKLGRGAIWEGNITPCIHQNHIFRVRLDQTCIIPKYFEAYLTHPSTKRYFLRCAKQTTGIASINMTQLRALPVYLPPINKQQDFASIVEKAMEKKTQLESSLDLLQKGFASLQQKCFSGELFA